MHRDGIVACRCKRQREKQQTRAEAAEQAPPFRRAKPKLLCLQDSSVNRASRKKSFKPYKHNAVATTSTKATGLSLWPAINTAMHPAPHSDKLVHNLGLRTYTKERHYHQRHRSCAMVRIILARKRCPYNTTISKPRRHSARSCHDWWRCDCPLPRSF